MLTRKQVLGWLATASRQRQLGLFVGTGFSIAVTTRKSGRSHALTFDALLRKLAQHLESKLDFEDVETVRGKALPTLASELERESESSLKAKGENEPQKLARRHLRRAVADLCHIPLLCCHAHTEEALASGGGGGVSPEFRCMDLGLPATVKCGTSACTVTHCGKSQCRFCPEAAPAWVKNLIVKAWGSDACMKGSTVTGGAGGAISTIGDKFIGPFLLPDRSEHTRA